MTVRRLRNLERYLIESLKCRGGRDTYMAVQLQCVTYIGRRLTNLEAQCIIIELWLKSLTEETFEVFRPSSRITLKCN
jgi:hypothetical protein